MQIKIVDRGQRDETEALALQARVDTLEVVDRPSYDLANAINMEAYARRKTFHEWFDPIDESSKKSRQAVIAQGKLIDEPLEYVIKITGRKQAHFIQAEKDLVVRDRKAAEAVARRDAEDAALAAAEELQAMGMTAAAEDALTAPIVMPKIIINDPEQAEGTFIRTTWSAEVTDLMALVKAVAAGTQPLAYLMANFPNLNGAARIFHGATEIPGVRQVSTAAQGRR